MNKSRRLSTVASLAVASVIVTACSGTSVAPLPSTPAGEADLEAGRVLFEANCAQCHGQEAQGTDQGPPFLHQYYRPGHHSDAAFYLAVRNGVVPHHWDFGPMPAIPGLEDDEIGDIVAYVRSLQEAAGIR